MNNDPYQQLPGRWLHSHEESDRDRIVLRTPAFAFPPARGRSGFTLAADGSAAVEHPGADDRGATAPGNWSVEGTLLVIDAPVWSGTYDIETLDGQVLVLHPRGTGG